jgi:C-terminal processing protease CtpA/Prc
MSKWVLAIIGSIVLTGCINEEQLDPSSQTIIQKKAQEDIGIFCNIIQKAHPSLNIYISPQRFSFLTDSILRSVNDDLTEMDLYKKINFIINEIGCSHTLTDLPAAMYDTLQNRAFFFPYPVKLVGNRLLVNIIDYNLKEGTEITYINKKPVATILKDLMMYNAVEGRHRKTQENAAADNFSLEYFYQYGQQKEFEIIYKDTLGSDHTIVEDAIKLSEWNQRNNNYKYYYDPVDVDYDFAVYDQNKYAYLKLSTFSFQGQTKQDAYENFCDNAFDLLAHKKNIRSLIIDLRENLGGSLHNAFYLYAYLTQQPFKEYEAVFSKIKTIPYNKYLDPDFTSDKETDINNRLEKEFSKKTTDNLYYLNDTLINQWKPAKNNFNGQVYVVTNSNVVSAASYFATMVKNVHRGKIVGEETAGGSFSGNGFSTLQYELPNSKIKFEFPYANIKYSFRDQKNSGHGLLPDYVVPDDYQSFKKNKDLQVSFIVDSLILNNK